jgi:hypothetical protein
MHCVKTFTSESSMYRHMREFCRGKDNAVVNKDSNPISQELFELRRDVEYLKKENNKLKNEIVPRQIINNTNNINGEININTGTINNITIVAYGKEDVFHIDREDIIKALKTGFNSTKHLTEVIHFNPKYPLYSNIKRSNFNMRNKLMYHNGNDWVTTSDPHMIDDLYNRKRDFIEENIENYQDGLTKGDITRLQRWLDVDDDDQRITKIKDDLRELLFNKKEIAEQNERELGIAFVNIKDIVETVENVENIENSSNRKTLKVMNIKKRKIAPRNGRKRKAIARKAI